MRKKRNRHRVLIGKPARKNRLEDLCLDGGILNYLKESDVQVVVHRDKFF